ncbi:MAG: glycosyltransferase family 4 protein [Opitutaceae bacterium]|nr:glycosyltransferase family 4 protein [Opitutaceae bacterium]
MSGPRILFLNQVAGPLFRELAEDVASALGSAELLTGHTADIVRPLNAALTVLPAPDYDRRSLPRRAFSWLRYFATACRKVAVSDSRQVLFIVSNPPFLPLLGWFAWVMRRQRYCVLVYDLYPGVLVRLGQISDRGPVAVLWRWFNRLVWARAALVFTIGEDLAANIRREGVGLKNLEVRVVPNWADVDLVKPLSAAQNPFRQSLGWAGRTIVLYSGNLGNTHNLDGLLQAAEKLRNRSDLGFLIIGAGARWSELESAIATRRLDNVRLLPFQPERLLPQTLPAGDIAVVAMEEALGGYMVPSKTYYYLAAGSALLALVPAQCEVADLIAREDCGIRVDAADAAAAVAAIERLLDDPERLAACRRRAREVAVRNYSRRNSTHYIEALRTLLGNLT